MKPVKLYLPRRSRATPMQELEAGDHPVDLEGRALTFVPGDMLVRAPHFVYVLDRRLADETYIQLEEETDGKEQRVDSR